MHAIQLLIRISIGAAKLGTLLRVRNPVNYLICGVYSLN